MNWLIQHYTDLIAILVGLVAVGEIVVKLTPTEKDNAFLVRVVSALSAIIPNFRKGGGKH
jgi:hypothetical protein